MKTFFPDELDGAKVIYFTNENDYGKTYFDFGDGNRTPIYYRYLAICRYSDDNKYYLFCCDNNKAVVRDTLWDSIDECMSFANNSLCHGIGWMAK